MFLKLIKFFVIISLLFLLGLPMLFIATLIKLSSKGPVIIWSRRIGYKGNEFKMPKFRTMKLNTPQVATHLLEKPEQYITNVGFYLRKYSLDELPQLFSILIGDMNIVGPRPALFNQHDLITLRNEKNIHQLKPGVTGWAQVNGRDELSIDEKIKYDKFYLDNRSIILDLRIVIFTFINILSKKNISH